MNTVRLSSVTAKMKPFNRSIILLVALASSFVHASVELDRIYGLRTYAAMVINTDQDPMFCEHVENEIIRYLKSHPRYEFKNEAYISFRDQVKEIYLRDAKVSTEDKVEWIRPQIQALKDKGVQAVVIAEVSRLAAQYRISLVTVSTNDLEFIQTRDVIVENSLSLDSFSEAVNRGMEELESKIPFDGTVIRRDGFRVVIDRGFPDVNTGEELVTYTVEKRGEEIVLEETGYLRIVEAGEQLSFGTILVEKKPKEVTVNNKLLLSSRTAGRDVAFLKNSSKPTSRLGELTLLLGASLVTVNNVAAGGAGVGESSKLFPGGALRTDIWLTPKTLLALGADFGTSTLSTGDAVQNSNLNDLRVSLGYQLGLGYAEKWKPTVRVRVGYSRHSFQVDPSSAALSFVSTVYSGILIGGTAAFRVTDRWLCGFDVNSLVFPSASESPTSGGVLSGVTGWDFGLTASYHLTENMNVLARLHFSSYSAEFSGQGSRPIALNSASQSAQNFAVGMAYVF